MDYSMFYPLIIREYCIVILGRVVILGILSAGFVWLLREYRKLKSVFIFIGIVGCMVGIITIGYFSRNILKDISYIKDSNYIIITGTAQGWDSAGSVPDTRGFDFERDDNGEVVNFQTYYYPVYQGDRFEVIYLPNTGVGAIVRKID